VMRLLCLLGFHKLRTVFKRPDSPAQDLTCVRCGRKFHTTYDMCYGETTLMPGHCWKSRVS